MSEHNSPGYFRHQSELSIAVASVFLAGGLFAVITAVLFPPGQSWSWPNPHVVAVATISIAVLVLIRGRHLRRIPAGCATGGFVIALIVSAALVESTERAVAAGLLIVGVILVFTWFMPTLVARLFGYASLASYSLILFMRNPGNDTVILALAVSTLSVLLTEVFGRFKRTLQRTSLTDHLCQVWNRAGFEWMLQKEIRSVARTHASLSLLYLDLDGFKAVNDREGHLAGDLVLQRVSRSLELNVRSRDTVARIGGDEFVLILPFTTAHEARVLGARLRDEVIDCAWSFGVAEYRAGETTQQFIERSDVELLAQKRKRRSSRMGPLASEERRSSR